MVYRPHFAAFNLPHSRECITNQRAITTVPRPSRRSDEWKNIFTILFYVLLRKRKKNCLCPNYFFFLIDRPLVRVWLQPNWHSGFSNSTRLFVIRCGFSWFMFSFQTTDTLNAIVILLYIQYCAKVFVHPMVFLINV
jgi:hypothetical protein